MVFDSCFVTAFIMTALLSLTQFNVLHPKELEKL